MACHCSDPGVTCERIEQQKTPGNTYADSDGRVPPYLPQPSDYITKPTKDKSTAEDSPLGPWATGRPIWNSTADLVGIRPVVDRYTITKYGPLDWRRGNLAVMEMVGEADSLKDSVKCTLDSVSAKADKNQNDNSIRLQQRFQDVRSYQNETEALILDLREEIVLLTEAKVRLKYALPALKMPESIAGECIDKRTCRIDPDLVKDEVDNELVKEMAMIYNMRELILKMLEQIEKQILGNRACKDELESNWSDKKETTDIDAANACLRNTSPTIFFKHGSTRMQHLQSTPETWEHYCRTLVQMGSQQVKKSRDLRSDIDSEIITGPIRDLRNQADKVLTLLKSRIEETDLCRQGFERQLQTVLSQIAETESLYEGLSKLLRQMDYNLKVAETRLDTRMYRPRTENCRDEAQYGSGNKVVNKKLEGRLRVCTCGELVPGNIQLVVRPCKRHYCLGQACYFTKIEPFPKANYRTRHEKPHSTIWRLIDEVKAINESQSALRKQVADVDATLAKLYQTRANLEFAIMTKRKSLYIDQQRCLAYREQYPDITTMTGTPI